MGQRSRMGDCGVSRLTAAAVPCVLAVRAAGRDGDARRAGRGRVLPTGSRTGH